MTVRECYAQMAGDYEGVLLRLSTEERLRRFLIKMVDDPTYAALEHALAKGNPEEAFRAAHTLKGVALNLGLTPLADTAGTMSEALRGGRIPADYAQLLEAVRLAYQRTVCAIQVLADGSDTGKDGGEGR